MTQSGRGEEPSARPAREGIVLPSDGGEPLLPGMTGAAAGQPVPATPPTTPPPSAPPGGQAWGNPWGPDQNTPSTPAAAPGQAWGAPEQQYQTPSAGQWGTGPDASGTQSPSSYGYGGPADSSPPPAQPTYGQGGAGMQYGQGQYGALPPEGQYGQHSHGGALPAAGADAYGAPGAGAPLPPAAPTPAPGGFGAPLPPADEGATQYIPQVVNAPTDEQATRYIPPVAADEGATQYIPPVGPGALPPEVSNESTQVLGRARQQGGAGPMPQAAGSDADATQYIPPVPGQPGPGRQPLSDFDNLFRSEPGGEPPAAATQQIPRFQQPQPQQQYPHQQQGYFPPGDPHGDDEGRRGRRTGSKVPLIAAVGVGIAVLGIGAGAMLAGGGGDDDKGEKNQPVSATAPATEGSSSPSADPAEEQAIALDKLLADSGDSRTAVINAVASVKSCGNLGQAAQDLRGAAKQRTQLVTDLSKLSVDQLPNHAALTTALTKAWQASASADNHYAAWADQVAGDKKLCKKGQARATGQTQAGNRASGTASQQKKTAAELWNEIAKKYGLTQRQPTQL
ncbi:hypothetical protein [Streptomyces lanatus]|uniref:Uncharacterized protein n=1 Tax=Streptomyces lanatus TaxID=66900 RepID=A0ABV1XSV0_9ACTN|nr:hypothetical protein [Streptomyces lanatus]GHH06919.1 hypothetical protein GCM10018780_40220 [Streptomyces lanatus]